MNEYVDIISLFCILIALSSAAKAAMDTRTFIPIDKAFESYPVWFKTWMQKRSTIPIIKINDGWHAMQAVMFLCTCTAFLFVGLLYSDLGYWILLAYPLRAFVHGTVFELLYPML